MHLCTTAQIMFDKIVFVRLVPLFIKLMISIRSDRYIRKTHNIRGGCLWTCILLVAYKKYLITITGSKNRNTNIMILSVIYVAGDFWIHYMHAGGTCYWILMVGSFLKSWINLLTKITIWLVPYCQWQLCTSWLLLCY